MNLGRRVASALVLLALLAGALWLQGPLLYVLLGAVTVIALGEYAALARGLGAPALAWVLHPLGVWLLFRFLLPRDLPATEWGLGAATVAGLLGALGLGRQSAIRWAVSVGGALLVGLCLGYYLGVLRLDGPSAVCTGAVPPRCAPLYARWGLRAVGVALAAVFAGDTAALLVGSAAGRHRFFPRLSPRKTVEGAVAGAVASVLVVGIAAPLVMSVAWYHAVVLGALIAVAAQGGDLVESALKRGAAVKDSGTLIPGHGGLLDRLDSLIFVGPVVYSYLRLITA